VTRGMRDEGLRVPVAPEKRKLTIPLFTFQGASSQPEDCEFRGPAAD
jgi:hypothetical protein